MRKKEIKLIVTFHTTADSIALEKECKKRKIPGRLIPVPRQLSAGCGTAWSSPLEERDAVSRALEEKNIEFEVICETLV